MSEAVTTPSLMMMTLTVSEESLVRDRHTHKRLGSSFFKFANVTYDFANKKIEQEEQSSLCWILA